MKSHFYKNLVFLSATKDYCKSPNFNAYKSIKIWQFAMVFVMLALFLSSCASDKKELKNASSEYKEAMELLNDKNNIEAAEKFEAIYDHNFLILSIIILQKCFRLSIFAICFFIW